MAFKDGVVFARKDCAGLIRRILLLLVDGLVIAGLGVVLIGAYRLIAPKSDSLWIGLLFGWLGFILMYLVVLKSFSWTLGFILTDVRIVNLQGKRPSVFRIAFRFLIWILGPFHMLLDLFWLSGDDQRQTLRDKLAATLVIRRRSKPLAKGPTRLKPYTLMGWSLSFLEVQKPDPPAPST
jgi:uncharacterized RDD family membrane protein YckC